MTKKRKCNCSSKNNASSFYTESIKKIYDKIAKTKCNFSEKKCGCSAKISLDIGYTKKEIEELAHANLGLGCGNPIELGEIRPGQTVLDLGSGAGLDCFLAAEKVGTNGHVIGVDITPAMIETANKNKENYGYKNVAFHLGSIEKLPVKNNTIDIIISNCVLSLAKNKESAFKEAFRVLKPGGMMYVSDIVLTSPLSLEQRTCKELKGSCVLGALLKISYIEKIINTGFKVNIIDEDLNVNQKKFNDSLLPISSLKFIAVKPN